jgi:hypothetical protein
VTSLDPEEEGSRRRPFSRRSLLRSGVLGAGAAAVLGTGLSGAATAAVARCVRSGRPMKRIRDDRDGVDDVPAGGA